MFRSLDARIAETAERLGRRISERFPGSGLEWRCRVAARRGDRCCGYGAHGCGAAVVGTGEFRTGSIARMLAIVIARCCFSGAAWRCFSSVADFVQGIDAAVNELRAARSSELLLLGWETRRKRRRARGRCTRCARWRTSSTCTSSTKDPERLLRPEKGTPSSPQRDLHRVRAMLGTSTTARKCCRSSARSPRSTCRIR